MTCYICINNMWPEFAELLARRPFAIHEFHLFGMDCLNKTFPCGLGILGYILYYQTSLHECKFLIEMNKNRFYIFYLFVERRHNFQ